MSIRNTENRIQYIELIDFANSIPIPDGDKRFFGSADYDTTNSDGAQFCTVQNDNILFEESGMYSFDFFGEFTRGGYVVFTKDPLYNPALILRQPAWSYSNLDFAMVLTTVQYVEAGDVWYFGLQNDLGGVGTSLERRLRICKLT